MGNKTTNMTEKYQNESGDLLNYVSYHSKHGGGAEEVLQHKKNGSEMAHITLHANGVINLREGRSKGKELVGFVKNGLSGFSPSPSIKLQAFLRRVKDEF